MAVRRADVGVTLVEVMVAMGIVVLVFSGSFMMLRNFASGQVSGVSEKLILQTEVRRAFVDLFQRIQEGVEILKPDPGATLPFLMLRDLENNLLVLFLKKHEPPVVKDPPDPDQYDLLAVVYDVEKAASAKPQLIMQGLRYLNFTAHGFGAVYLSGLIQKGKHGFPFMNMIRLKNLATEDI